MHFGGSLDFLYCTSNPNLSGINVAGCLVCSMRIMRIMSGTSSLEGTLKLFIRAGEHFTLVRD